MDANIFRKWIESISSAANSIAIFYTHPKKHWLIVDSEKSKDTAIRLVQILFLSTIVELLVLSLTYSGVIDSFGLKVARVIVVRLGIAILQLPALILALRLARPVTRPTLRHIGDYIVIHISVTALVPRLAFAVFYATETYFFYVAGTILVFVAAGYYFVRVAFVSSSSGGVIRRFLAVISLITWSIIVGIAIVFVSIPMSVSQSKLASIDPFNDPIASEVMRTSLSLNKELQNLNTINFVLDTAKACGDIMTNVMFEYNPDQLKETSLVQLTEIHLKLEAIMQSDRACITRIESQTKQMNEKILFGATNDIVKRTVEAISSYSRFLDQTELFFRYNSSYIELLADSAKSALNKESQTQQLHIQVDEITTIEDFDRQVSELNEMIKELRKAIGMMTDFTHQTNELINLGQSATNELQRVLGLQEQFYEIVERVRNIVPFYSVWF